MNTSRWMAMCLAAGLMLSGCTTSMNLATGEQEYLMYDTAKEVRIGQSMVQTFDKQFDLVQDVAMNERVRKILDRIVAVSDRKDVRYTIKIIDDEKLNAVSLPGGPIYLFRGIIEHAEDDDQIASVVAHEVAHIAAKHSMKRLQAIYGQTLLTLVTAASGDGALAKGVSTVIGTVFIEHSQADELISDKLAVKYLDKAGYRPEAMVEFLEIMQEEQAKRPLRPISYARTHPHIPQRIASANREVSGEYGFEDYLNLTGEENVFYK